MTAFEFKETALDALVEISPFCSIDERGYFIKSFEINSFSVQGIRFSVAEELESKSKRGTLRGLHFQTRHSQDKLVRVLAGEIYDVAVDLRKDSDTFGRWAGFFLSDENRKMLYIPKGFAHGFLVRSQEAVVHYLCGDRYDPDSETGILWNDPELNIGWPLEPGETPALSPRDWSFQTFAEFRRTIGL